MKWLTTAAAAILLALVLQVWADVKRINALEAEPSDAIVVIDRYRAWNTVNMKARRLAETRQIARSR